MKTSGSTLANFGTRAKRNDLPKLLRCLKDFCCVVLGLFVSVVLMVVTLETIRWSLTAGQLDVQSPYLFITCNDIMGVNFVSHVMHVLHRSCITHACIFYAHACKFSGNVQTKFMLHKIFLEVAFPHFFLPIYKRFYTNINNQ